MASSIVHKLSRFDLPGFTLPLNFSPHKSYTKRVYDAALASVKEIQMPASKEGNDLFPSALSPTDGEDGSQYEPCT